MHLTFALCLFTFLTTGPSWSASAEVVAVIWDYSQICRCSHRTFDFDRGPRLLFCVLYIARYTRAAIRLFANRRGRQTSLIVEVFISSYVTHLTFFFFFLASICSFIAENSSLPVDIIVA